MEEAALYEEKKTMTHAFTWVELPSTDFDRAVDFYSEITGRDIDVYDPEEEDSQNGRAGMFHTEDGDVGGMILENEEFTAESGATIPYTPTVDSGPVVYLTVDGDLDTALSHVESSGGEVLIPKENIPEMDSYYAVVADTEGNRVGLTSST
ncbi:MULTISPECIES: VOC family protein [Natrialbaceae]|uniref:VOC family protein n=1 Tax=Natrialbaceae TaxID=1644061 RepID=UPI00207C38F8|nr:VOC family protein [Natronococcus sp. CG52]